MQWLQRFKSKLKTFKWFSCLNGLNCFNDPKNGLRICNLEILNIRSQTGSMHLSENTGIPPSGKRVLLSVGSVTFLSRLYWRFGFYRFLLCLSKGVMETSPRLIPRAFHKYLDKTLLRDCFQISILILNEFKRIKYSLFPWKHKKTCFFGYYVLQGVYMCKLNCIKMKTYLIFVIIYWSRYSVLCFIFTFIFWVPKQVFRGRKNESVSFLVWKNSSFLYVFWVILCIVTVLVIVFFNYKLFFRTHLNHNFFLLDVY